MGFDLTPIGRVAAGRERPEDDGWGQERATIQLDPDRFEPAALAGLDTFSHVEIIFVFHQVAPTDIEYGARHPRGRADWPRVGIFAQRGRNRPNRLGVSVARLLRVEGLALEVEGLDAIAGTPVVDIKPVMFEFLPRGAVRQPEWATALMQGYWDGEITRN